MPGALIHEVKHPPCFPDTEERRHPPTLADRIDKTPFHFSAGNTTRAL